MIKAMSGVKLIEERNQQELMSVLDLRETLDRGFLNLLRNTP